MGKRFGGFGGPVQDVGLLAWVGIGLGVLGVLGGFAGNSAVLILGIVAIALGWWAQAAGRRDIARWAVGCGALSVVGYLGTVAQTTA